MITNMMIRNMMIRNTMIRNMMIRNIMIRNIMIRNMRVWMLLQSRLIMAPEVYNKLHRGCFQDAACACATGWLTVEQSSAFLAVTAAAVLQQQQPSSSATFQQAFCNSPISTTVACLLLCWCSRLFNPGHLQVSPNLSGCHYCC